MPPIGPIVSAAYLSSLRSYPNLPQHTWYFLASVALSALNRPSEITTVLTYALEHGVQPHVDSPIHSHEERLLVARRTREALVKSSVILGLPKTINALTELKKGTPSDLLDPPASYSPTRRTLDMATTPLSATLHRGSHLWSRLYGKIAHRVQHQLDGCGTEDLGHVARLQYGFILSGGNGILSDKETSFTVLAGLVPQDVNPQLKGHLKGALNLGATRGEVEAVRGAVVQLCERAGMKVGEASGWAGEVAKL
jgi:alkylhydroperoxidase/carboxymuconolactone decarboxylase family protein YurZ